MKKTADEIELIILRVGAVFALAVWLNSILVTGLIFTHSFLLLIAYVVLATIFHTVWKNYRGKGKG